MFDRLATCAAAFVLIIALGGVAGALEPGEAELAREASLDTILRIALAKNPDFAEARARARASRERGPAASRLPDPEFKYELQGAPLQRPYAMGDAQMHMFGLRQMFPAPGTLGAQSGALEEVALASREMERARELDVAVRVRRAYAEYYRADREAFIHREHATLAQQIVEFAGAAYRAGQGSQQDVLRSSVAMSRLHADLARVDSDRRSARASLNTLMGRPPDAPLGPPASLDGARERAVPKTQELDERAGARPEVLAAEHAARSRDKEVEAAKAGGRWPSFMVGLDYQYMPMEHEPHGYGLMFSMSLPWLNPRYGEEARAAEASRDAERSLVDSLRNTARYELYQAVARAEAAKQTLTLIEGEVLPQAQQSFEVARAAYRGAQGDSLALLDSLRSLLEIRIERERALASLFAALADVDRAAGTEPPFSLTKKEK